MAQRVTADVAGGNLCAGLIDRFWLPAFVENRRPRCSRGSMALYGLEMSTNAQSGSFGVCVALLMCPNRLNVNPEFSTT